jgi:hypothetical protein
LSSRSTTITFIYFFLEFKIKKPLNLYLYRLRSLKNATYYLPLVLLFEFEAFGVTGIAVGVVVDATVCESTEFVEAFVKPSTEACAAPCEFNACELDTTTGVGSRAGVGIVGTTVGKVSVVEATRVLSDEFFGTSITS